MISLLLKKYVLTDHIKTLPKIRWCNWTKCIKSTSKWP